MLTPPICGKLLSQQMLQNGSFEIKDNVPNKINGDNTGAEVTRCVSFWWEYYSAPYPKFDSLNLPVSGPDWYQPTEATADYFHEDADSIDGCSVPNNKFTTPSNKQRPTSWESDNSQKAYTGINNRRRFINGVQDDNYGGTKNEYIQKKLENPLAPGNSYAVKFRVSRARKVDYDTTYMNFALYQLAAYFSSDSVDVFKDDILPIDIDEGHEYLARRIENEPFWKTGGYRGDRWIEITDYIQVDRDDDSLRYITIGNFQYTWDSDNVFHPTLGISQWDVVEIYYFIDSVHVYPEEYDCACGQWEGPDDIYGTHKLHYFPKPKEKDDPDCCYDVYISVEDHHRVCDVDQVKIYKTGGVTPEIDTNITLQPGDYKYLGVICYDTSDHGNTVWPYAKLYNNYQYQCEIGSEFEMRCKCGCEDGQSELYGVQVELEETTIPGSDECCWNLILKYDGDECDKYTNKVFVEIDTSDALIADNPDDDWGMAPDADGYYFAGDENSLQPGDSIFIGSICTGRLPYYIPFEIKFFEPGEQTPCPNTYSDSLFCDPCDTVTDCCEDIWVEWGPNLGYPWCCHMLNFHQYNNCCDIYGYNVFQWNCSSYDSLYRASSLSPMNISMFPTEVCPVVCNSEPVLKIKVEFLDSLGQVICYIESEYEEPCDEVAGKAGFAGRYGESPSAHLFVSGIRCIPNPAGDEATVSFDISRDADLMISMYDMNGAEISEIFSGRASEGENSMKFGTSKFESGRYLIRLMVGRYTYSIPLTIIH